MKLILGVAGIFLVMATVSIGGFLAFNDNEGLAMISAAVGNEQECDGRGNSGIDILSTVSWTWFQIPGVSERYIEQGGSFLYPATQALTCRPGQALYQQNLEKVQRNILHGIGHGESLDTLADNGLNLVHMAILSNQTPLLQFLARRGADFSATSAADASFNGMDVGIRTPLELARLQDQATGIDPEIFVILGDQRP